MEIKGVNKIFLSARFAGFIILSLFLSTKAHSQTLQVTATGTNTFKINVSNVYSWRVDEYVNGRSIGTFLTGGANGVATGDYTRKGGTYTFRLENCYPMSGGCSTSSSKDVFLSGSAPAAPTIKASTSETSITVSWTKPTGTDSFIFTRNGIQTQISGTSYSEAAPVSGTTYSYSVKGCNSLGDCSAYESTSAALVINPSTYNKTLIYTYDALGRVTFVSDPVNGNRDYDYDNAGNRLNVATGTANDAASEPEIPSAPTGLKFNQIGDCAYQASWNAPANITQGLYYSVGQTRDATKTTTATTIVISCDTGQPASNKPKWVTACNSVGCSAQVNFN